MTSGAKFSHSLVAASSYTEQMKGKFFESHSSEQTNGDDGAVIEPVAQTGANIFIFMPAISIAFIYGGIWFVLWLIGHADGLIGRIAFALFVLAPPLLLARAFLKFYSAGLALTDEDVLIAPGWPHQTGIEVTIDSVDSVEIHHSRMAQLFGAADVRIRLKDDTLIKIPDLDHPERLVRLIAARIGQSTATA